MSARAERAPAVGARAAARARKLERILAAAEQLFALQGFAKTTVDEIAARAGVSKGLVYDHYASKEDLLASVWAMQVEAWMEATTGRVKYSEGAIADAIGEVMGVSLRYARDNPLLRRMLMQDPGMLMGHQSKDVNAFGRFYRENLEPALRHGVASGELRADLDVDHTAELIWLLHFTLVRELFVGPPHGWRDDGESLIDATIRLILAGIRAR
jgi:AcrR family transcriptional regulator